MSRERWFLIAGAAGSVVGDILLAVLAARPSGLYLLPWLVVGTAMVGVKIGFELYQERMAERSGRPLVRVRTTRGGGELIRGRRQGAGVEPDSDEFMLLLGVFFFALLFVVFGAVAMSGRVGAHGGKAIGLGLSFEMMGWIILALLYRFAYGLPACLTVSAEGVTFTGRRGNRTLRERVFITWRDVLDFTITETEHTGGPWLAAVPPQRSSLIFRGATSRLYDAANNLILVCNLDDVGMQKHVVAGALDQWRPALDGSEGQG